MTKKNLTIIFLVIVILISSYFIVKNLDQKEEIILNNQVEPVMINEEELIITDSFETKVLNPNNAYVKFEVKYPYFKKASTDFNASIENLIKKQIDEHMVMSVENWKARYDTQVGGENIPVTPNKEEDKFSFFSDFEIVQSNSTYISFVLKYGGFSGGAHGYENIFSYNYKVDTGENIKLDYLFQDNPQYLTTISNISREYLKKRFAVISEEDKKNSDPEALKEYVNNMVSMIEEGTKPIEENFSVFTFTPDKIKIYFSQYQVGPYVIGMPEVEIDRK